MWLPILGFLIGLFVGLFSGVHVAPEYASYVSIAVLAALDTLFGGIRAQMQGTFDNSVFVSGFFFNMLLASGLAFLGVHIGVDLYLAAIFAFGVRLFNNIAAIRRLLLAKWSDSYKPDNGKKST
ncbi:small basic family protein [Bacillaceae bacterium SIJ1]|uniref:small basic family protein n=1 Tax=Litoribacterium kuwaitense TaxID=1398745 RepID=UPI0013EB4B75|nr:small basic family protein [Litoribacterium kuwaitense]NGP44338.1 small basic family protein [Litoribacterium kuwaitense]